VYTIPVTVINKKVQPFLIDTKHLIIIIKSLLYKNIYAMKKEKSYEANVNYKKHNYNYKSTNSIIRQIVKS
jgi:hypothetical protein